MENQYAYEQIASQRQQEIQQTITANRLSKAVRDAAADMPQTPMLLDGLTRSRRMVRLGRLVIMW